MTRIEFGFNNANEPCAAFQGIGIKEGVLLVEADYYGTIKYDDNSYIVAKVTEDEYNRFPNLLGNFIVRGAVADLYPDGSGNIYLDQEESLVSKQLENFLNNPTLKSKINDVDDIINYCSVNRGDNSFKFLTMGDKFYATSIKHEVFENMNQTLKKCSQSFFHLQTYYQMNKSNNYSR